MTHFAKSLSCDFNPKRPLLLHTLLLTVRGFTKLLMVLRGGHLDEYLKNLSLLLPKVKSDHKYCAL